MRLIDADMLYENALTAVSMSFVSDNKKQAAMAVAEMIRSAQTVDAQPVIHGEWRSYSPLTDTFECNQCGYQVIDESFRTNFCPHCGADMRG